MSPLVSVLMSCYNAEQYVRDAIDSLLNQTYQNIEYIFINDGSSDKTLAIIESFDDERITIISHANKGIVPSLNEGLKQCSGIYIARMDADDISKLDRIEKQVAFLEAHKDISACGGSINEFNDNGFVKLTTKPSDHVDLLFYSLHHAPISNPSSMIRTSVLVDNNLEYDPIYKYSQDVKLWSDIAQVGQLANIDDVLLEYRQSTGQITTFHRPEQKLLAKKVRAETYEYLKENLETIGDISKHNHYLYLKYMVKSDDSLSKKQKVSLILSSAIRTSHKIVLSLRALFDR